MIFEPELGINPDMYRPRPSRAVYCEPQRDRVGRALEQITSDFPELAPASRFTRESGSTRTAQRAAYTAELAVDAERVSLGDLALELAMSPTEVYSIVCEADLRAHRQTPSYEGNGHAAMLVDRRMVLEFMRIHRGARVLAGRR